ncbi:hypothetical protein [Epilithonimonas zeae]|uniref:hypothetical protein n=1 Tax=Epilithonimonas zeae TaxID=1416779 RepID=UPI00200FE00D|nr:hypothetical protein [Epilithonimonas zeae]UQB69595.1 hypothetical protein KI430_03970 [Epilithonimonas zeae]
MRNIKTYKRLIIINIFLFILSFSFMEYSNIFRINQEKHWVYSTAHSWYLFFAFPVSMIGSLVLSIITIIKILKQKYIWLFLSLVPIIIFLLLPKILMILNLRNP